MMSNTNDGVENTAKAAPDINKYLADLKLDREFIENTNLLKARKAAQEENAKKYNANAKARLLKTVEKKFKTTYIGALASFETAFGFLWGHGKRDEDLTDSEREFAKQWSAVRTEVLNKGNNNSRAAQEEIAQHDVIYNKYRVAGEEARGELVLKKENF